MRERSCALLIAEDDEDDYLLIAEALRAAAFARPYFRVKDGEELLSCLAGKSASGELGSALVVMLDLNMPRMDGREVLKRMKSDAALKNIPVIVFTTSRDEKDVETAYGLGANSFLRKPVEFEELVRTIEAFARYWFDSAELPRTSYSVSRSGAAE